MMSWDRHKRVALIMDREGGSNAKQTAENGINALHAQRSLNNSSGRSSFIEH